MNEQVLITIPPSHYCEKVRWALDYAGIEYREDPHLPIFHRKATSKYQAKSVPVFITKDFVLKDSSEIMKYVDQLLPEDKKLFPPGKEKEIAALEELFDEKLGPHTRRLAYYFLLEKPSILFSLFASSPKNEQFYFKLFFPLIKFLLKKGMKIDKKSCEKSKGKIKEIFAKVDLLLADGRKFLTGEKISAADLTFAALAAPVIFPKEYADIDLTDLPNDFRQDIAFFLNSKSGQFVLELFKNHRKRN